MAYDAVILGAGPAGLAVAHAMLRAGAKVKVLEPAARVGGSIRTHLEDGWIVETGPNTLQLEGAEDEALLAAYGLGEAMQSADMRAARRYIFARGELHGLGPSPLTLLTSRLLSWSGKLRLLSEPFRAKGGRTGETVVEFAARRFGPEAAAMLMDPIVSGVHAGDPARLVMASCFPRIHALEQEHGSVLNGLRRGPKTKRTVVGFPGGMRQLAEAMAGRLPAEDVRLGVVTTSLRRDARGWNVAWRGADGMDEGVSARHLVVTAPSWHWGSLPFDESVTPFLRDWEDAAAPPVAVVARGYARADVPHPLDGFGYLTPGSEQRDVLGCLFPSSVLPGRAPEGHVLVCCFIGGDRRPELARLPDEALRRLVDDELATTLGVKEPPRREWIQRWERAIPQYDAGQSRREAALARAEAAHPGLRFHGAFRGGISLMQVIRKGDALGRSLAEA
ncbi:MAG: protoporphyrinogen oxidase [Verrucomicrobia bacterium]|nr:protoporphyrinogen oxidase [Verrucomicrobiota bacterium]